MWCLVITLDVYINKCIQTYTYTYTYTKTWYCWRGRLRWNLTRTGYPQASIWQFPKICVRQMESEILHIHWWFGGDFHKTLTLPFAHMNLTPSTQFTVTCSKPLPKICFAALGFLRGIQTLPRSIWGRKIPRWKLYKRLGWEGMGGSRLLPPKQCVTQTILTDYFVGGGVWGGGGLEPMIYALMALMHVTTLPRYS